MPTFAELAHSLREERAAVQEAAAHLAASHSEAVLVEAARLRARAEALADASVLLRDLLPHEAVVRALIETGGLVELPEFSGRVGSLAPGMTVLVRATLRADLGGFVQISFAHGRHLTTIETDRSAIVGVAR